MPAHSRYNAPMPEGPRLMWGDKRVSVVLMTYAERDSIRAVIEGFYATGVVDEVLVVNNNAQEGTAEEVERTDGAPGVRVPAGLRARQPPGPASRRRAT